MKTSVPNWIKLPVHSLIKKYTSVRVGEIQALEARLEVAERWLDFVSAEETNRWLYQNRLERMDATLDIFDKKRREFHLDRYRFAMKWVKEKRVLDCACGTGYGVRMVREDGAAAGVIGIDIEATALAYATKKHQPAGTAFLCSSGDQLALEDDCVDVIISFETIEHVPDDRALLREFHRVLRPHGTLLISTPNNWPVALSPFHRREYDRNSFTKAFEEWFECVKLYNQNSGADSPYNHDQPTGIVETTSENERLAECYIAVCRRKL